MPFNGSGTFTPHSPEYPVVSGTTIRASDWNTIVGDIATGLSNALCRDGQSSPTANINWGGKKITNLADGTTAADAMTFSQGVTRVDLAQQTYTAISATGTSTAYILTPNTPLTSYSGIFASYFVIFPVLSGAAPTINISGLGALPLVKWSTARTYIPIAAGDIGLGQATRITVMNTFVLVESFSSGGRLINIQRISATGTYTPTTGTNSVFIKLIGGGGGGGGAGVTVAAQISAGAGGSAAGYAESYLTSGFSGVTVTIGAGGTVSAGAAGGNGGSSSFGAVFSASGGSGGSAGGAFATGSSTFTQASIGGGGTSGNILNTNGQPGGNGLYQAVSSLSGYGGPSVFGGGGVAVQVSAGVAAQSAGAGGSGAANAASSAAQAGGAGGAGLCIIYEYS